MKKLLFLTLLFGTNAFGAVTALDAANQSLSGFHATISPSAGSNRWVFVGVWLAGNDITDPTGATLGGQTMTLLAGGIAPAAHDCGLTIFGLNEAGIAAMSGTTLDITGEATDGVSASVWWSVQDADQSSVAGNEAAGTGTSVSISLARVADGYTSFAACHDNANGFDSSANPTFSVDIDFGSFYNMGYGFEASTSETVNSTYTHTFNRPYEAAVINVGPAGAGGSSIIPAVQAHSRRRR